MPQKDRKQPTARTLSKKIEDTRRIRYGAGHAPARIIRPSAAATADTGAIRFGAGHAPASLGK